jgi:hypothetical protein
MSWQCSIGITKEHNLPLDQYLSLTPNFTTHEQEILFWDMIFKSVKIGKAFVTHRKLSQNYVMKSHQFDLPHRCFAFKVQAQKQLRQYRVLHFEVSISAPRLDLGFKSQRILALARARSIWDFQPLDAKARTTPVDFSDVLDIKAAR